MPEARERKKADKIKEKSDRRVSPVKKTMRRRMTAKLQKELIEQKQGRERPADGRKTRPPESSRSTITSSDKAAASERPPAGPAPGQGLPRKNGCGKRPGRTPRRGTKRLGLP